MINIAASIQTRSLPDLDGTWHKHDFLNSVGKRRWETIKNESECLMRKARRESSGWPVCLGIFMAYVGIALIGFGGWYSLKPSLRWLIYLAGFIVFLAGLFLVWKDLLNAPAYPEEPISPPGGHFLGEFELNGHIFKAYELQTAQDGRQFRLFSSPQLTPEREAAFIRYIVNEGLVEHLWQGLSKKIEEEATWAFLPK